MKKRIANWGNYPVIESDEKRFAFQDQLVSLVKSNSAFIARGNGRCYGDASLGGNTISTLSFDKILSFDTQAGVFECQSGITLDRVLEVIVPKGWFLPVTPGTKFITVGGAVASDVHGKNHHVDGSFSNHIIDMDVMTESGEVLTCSREKFADLFEATCGGMGLTGVITRIKFDLKKIESSYIAQKQVKAKNLEEVLELFTKYQNYTYSVAWIDCLKSGKGFGRSILILGEHASVDQLPDSRKADPLKLPRKKQLSFPFYLPSWTLNNFTVRIFNELYYAKNTRREQNNIVSYEPFFYPLDAILHWNRGYGRKGFVQYQFVLPLAAKNGLVEILNRISKNGLASFLAVLKVFGRQDDMISFPTEGYTLALDFPVRDKLFPFLDELDALVLQYGGRIYMSKDARMNPLTLRQGYPRIEEFKQVLRKYNPRQRVLSIQSERLKLTDN
jgi:decaprenylphospho-beta-D-ribofuranose 2-oxidase